MDLYGSLRDNIRWTRPRDELELGKVSLHIGKLPLVAEQENRTTEPVLSSEHSEQLSRFLDTKAQKTLRRTGGHIS